MNLDSAPHSVKLEHSYYLANGGTRGRLYSKGQVYILLAYDAAFFLG